MKYPKIDTYWKRDDKGRIIYGEVSDPVFENIKHWLVTEKIHGTNTRIMLRGDKVIIGSKNIDQRHANFESWYPELQEYLKETFTVDKLKSQFSSDVTLFGEGYGHKINHSYGRDDVSFQLFDVVVHTTDIELNQHHWWLRYDDVVDIARLLGIEVVQFFGVMTFDKAEELLKSYMNDDMPYMEGIVCQASPQVLRRYDKTPLKFKLKIDDYKRITKSKNHE